MVLRQVSALPKEDNRFLKGSQIAYFNDENTELGAVVKRKWAKSFTQRKTIGSCSSRDTK